MFKTITRTKLLIITAISFAVIALLLMYYEPNNRIVRTAHKYLGEEEEVGNSGFKNKSACSIGYTLLQKGRSG